MMKQTPLEALRIARRVLAAATVAACAACSGGALGSSAPASRPAVISHVERVASLGPLNAEPTSIMTPPPGIIYAGARVATKNNGTIDTLEAQIGRTLALDNHYEGWTEKFPSAEESDDQAHGRLPILAWNCKYSNASVAAGTHDADIIAAATNIKAYKQLFMLRYFWEFNLSDNANDRQTCWDKATDEPNGYFSPTEFIAAWKHIYNVFAAQNVHNVIWFWCGSSGGTGGAPVSAFYPGDAYVDWIGFDAYATQPKATFIDTFSLMYSQLQTIAPTKPILIAESAAIPSNQVPWLTGGATILQSTFPAVKGWMYFDVYSANDLDNWALTPKAITTFAADVNTKYMSAFPVFP